MNNDLISRSALLAAKWDWCDAEDAIKDAPAVDAVEVVRCESCKHSIRQCYVSWAKDAEMWILLIRRKEIQ